MSALSDILNSVLARGARLVDRKAAPDGGLRAMEDGVVFALRDIAIEAGCDWESIGASLKSQGRLHLETY